MTRDVAVIIASLNSPMIHEVVAAVAAQEGVEGVREVLVVGRDDAELLQPGRLPGGGAVRLLDTGRPVSAAVARNLGLAAITADDTLVIFLDADCLPQAGWLRAHLAAHAHPGPPHVVSGSVITPTDTYWSLVYNLSLFYAFLDTAPAAAHLALPTLNLSFPFALSRIVGPFDETLLRAADMDWTLRARRAGIALVFDPAPSVVHRHARHSLRAVWHDCAKLRLSLAQDPFALRRARGRTRAASLSPGSPHPLASPRHLGHPRSGGPQPRDLQGTLVCPARLLADQAGLVLGRGEAGLNLPPSRRVRIARERG
jgi:glycosyltransferase involved in cell wall biosynthesis